MACNSNGECNKSVEKYLSDIKFSHSFSPKCVKKVKPGHLSSVVQQQKYAERQLCKAQMKLATAPPSKRKEQLEDDVWAWGIFSQTVLPMLSFLDE
jgi:hypothetical protein